MASDLAPVLPFPKRLGFCPQCGWRHPDPNIKLITHCPECDAAPLYPWKCPECGEKHEATAKDLVRWSLTTRRHPSRGIRFGFPPKIDIEIENNRGVVVVGCPECKREMRISFDRLQREREVSCVCGETDFTISASQLAELQEIVDAYS